MPRRKKATSDELAGKPMFATEEDEEAYYRAVAAKRQAQRDAADAERRVELRAALDRLVLAAYAHGHAVGRGDRLMAVEQKANQQAALDEMRALLGLEPTT